MGWVNKISDFHERNAKRLSLAGITLAIVWLVCVSTFGSFQNKRLLEKAEGREERLAEQLDELNDRLDEQRALTTNATRIASDVQAKLDVSITQNQALAEQLRRLGAQPVINSSSDDTRPSEQTETGSVGPPGPQGPPGERAPSPPHEPPPEDPGTLGPVLDTVCELTAMLRLC